MLKTRLWQTCSCSDACGIRGNPVWGSGPRESRIMIIGEAPGKWEDKYGKPFVGKSGKELDNYLSRFAHISRDACYVTNLLKCRPDSRDRDPKPEEIAICTEAYLVRELTEVAPRFIIAAGKFAASWLFQSPVKMEMVHGIGYRWEGFGIAATVIPVYHPSYGLHSTRKMRFIQEDFESVGEIVRGAGDVREWVKFDPQATIVGEYEEEDGIGDLEGENGVPDMG
ncbi:MAG: uracil-DNA glycosylase [Patescibacteria group bacterium]